MIKIDEKHFEDILFDGLQTRDGIKNLMARGLYVKHEPHSVLYRQLNLGKYGIPDIVRISFPIWGVKIKVEVIELKISEFDISHLLQLGRYLSGIYHFISKNETLCNMFTDISGSLIVSGFDENNDYAWLGEVVKHEVTVYSTSYSIDGLRFIRRLPEAYLLEDFDPTVGKYVDMDILRNLFKRAYSQRCAVPGPDDILKNLLPEP